MDEIQRVLQALRSPVRREILWLVGDREGPAGEIAAAAHVSAPTVSEHLKVLRDAGLVAMLLHGNFRYYREHPRPRDAHSPSGRQRGGALRWRGLNGASDRAAGRSRDGTEAKPLSNMGESARRRQTTGLLAHACSH